MEEKDLKEVNQNNGISLLNKYDINDLVNTYINNANVYYNELNNVYDIDGLMKEYDPSKGMYPLQTKLNQKQVIELSVDFFKDINPEYARYFINDITNNKNRIFFSENPKTFLRDDGELLRLEVTNYGDLRDLYTVVHEYTHIFDDLNGNNDTRKLISETNAQCMERCLDSYLNQMPLDKLNNYGIDKKQLEEDITDRNLATYFNRLDNIKKVNNGKGNLINSKYMLSQIYSDHFEKLDYNSQKVAINNMINETKNNNLSKVVSNIPCDLSKDSKSRNDDVNYSIKNTIKKVDKKINYQQINNKVNVEKPKTLVKKNATSNTSNSGFIDTFVLSLILGFICGVVSVLSYLFISR